jgi:hypothetical protein
MIYMFFFIRNFKSHVAYPLPFPQSTGGMATVHDCAVPWKRGMVTSFYISEGGKKRKSLCPFFYYLIGPTIRLKRAKCYSSHECLYFKNHLSSNSNQNTKHYVTSANSSPNRSTTQRSNGFPNSIILFKGKPSLRLTNPPMARE